MNARINLFNRRLLMIGLDSLFMITGCGQRTNDTVAVNSFPEALPMNASDDGRQEQLATRSLDCSPGIYLGKEIDVETTFLILAASGQMWPACELVEDGVPFTVGTENGCIVYIGSSSRGFTLPSGEVVGVTTFNELTEQQRRAIVHEPGYAYYCDVGDDWKVAWNEQPTGEDVITWVFKR